MNSKETSHSITTFLCICFLFTFFQCTSSQPISTDLLKNKLNKNDDSNVADSFWLRPLSTTDSDELNMEDNDLEEFLPLLSAHLSDKEHDENNRSNAPSIVRRANFWKRANFWRKRANFWRRDLAA